MSEPKKRLTDGEVAAAWEQDAHVRSMAMLGAKADHLRAREVLKRMAEMLRELEFSKHIRGYGQCCPICNEESHADDCRLAALLSEVSP